MDREYFRSVLKRYLQGQATAEEIELIESWYADMERNNDDDRAASADSELGERYWSSIQEKIGESKTRTMFSWRMVGVAASFLIAAVVFTYVALDRSNPQHARIVSGSVDDELQIISNQTQAAREVVLPDSSQVILEPHSRLTYTSAYNKSERAVTLEGGAFFKVARDEQRPFLVETNKLTTRVLGTSFRVEAFAENKKVIVSVKTGKVSVYETAVEDERDEIPEVILTPNQQVVFDEVERKMSRMIVESPQAIVPKEELQRMRFEEAPVTEIFAAVEKVYGVDLVFDEKGFSSCSLTSVISDGDLYSRLDIICDAIGASYEVRGDHIVIAGSECNVAPEK